MMSRGTRESRSRERRAGGGQGSPVCVGREKLPKKLEKLAAPGVVDLGLVENVLRVGSHHRVSSEGNARDKGQIWLSEGP